MVIQWGLRGQFPQMLEIPWVKDYENTCPPFLKKNSIYLFVTFGCVGPLLLHGLFSSWQEWELLSRSSVWASQCGVFSWFGAGALGLRGFCSYSSQALEHSLSSYGAWALLVHGMWDPPGSGIEPMSPVLAGRFFTTGPLGEPNTCPCIGSFQLSG